MWASLLANTQPSPQRSERRRMYNGLQTFDCIERSLGYVEYGVINEKVQDTLEFSICAWPMRCSESSPPQGSESTTPLYYQHSRAKLCRYPFAEDWRQGHPIQLNYILSHNFIPPSFLPCSCFCMLTPPVPSQSLDAQQHQDREPFRIVLQSSCCVLHADIYHF